jgi:putative ABC transport system permease protein
MIRRLSMWLRTLVRRDAVESEMDREMRAHLEFEVEANLRAGMSPAEARRAALIAFGGMELTKEQVRDEWGTRAVESFFADLRLAVRRLRSRPAFSLTVLATLAVGLSALAAAYGVAYGVLFRPLPYPSADRLVMIWQTMPGWERFPSSWPSYESWVRETSSFEGLAAYGNSAVIVIGEGEAERLAGSPATANLAEVLGVEPLYGRWFTEEESLGGAPVVVVSHSFWATYLGGSPAAVGSQVRLSEGMRTVIGVMPPRFRFLLPTTAMWLPIGPDDRARGWRSQFLRVVGRLQPDRTVEGASADVAMATGRAVASGDSPEVGSRVLLLRDDVVGGVRRSLILALGAAAAVLLLGFLNVANLFLARGTTARQEVALQQMLGAKRLRLARQLVVEGMALAVTGAALGLLLAQLTLRTLDRVLPTPIPRVSEIAVDAPVILVMLVVAAVLGVALGLIASASAFRFRVSSPIGAGPRHTTAGPAARRFRAALVAAQVAGVFSLLSGAGLMLESLSRLTDGDRGFEESGLAALVEPEVLEERFPDGAVRNDVLRQLAAGFAAVPAVQGAALVAPLPFSGSERNWGVTLREGEDPTDVGVTEVTASAFEVMGVRLLEGRVFGRTDEGPASVVAIVGESLARMIRPQGSVVGMTLPMAGGLRIVGVVADVRQAGLNDRTAPPRVWLPWSDTPGDDVSVVARTTGDPMLLLSELRGVVVQVEPALAAERLTTMAELVHDAAFLPRFRALLLVVLAVAASAIAAVGVYGVTSYAVVERRRDLSIRIALGARAARVVGDTVKREAPAVLVGLALGLPAALLVGRALRGFLHEVGPDNPAVHSLTALAILVLSTAAAAVPVMRAIRTDPAGALKED